MAEYQASHKYSGGQVIVTQDRVVSLKFCPKSPLIVWKKVSPSILKKTKKRRSYFSLCHRLKKNTQVYFEELDIKYCIFITAINVNISLSLISCKLAEVSYRFLVMIFCSWHWYFCAFSPRVFEFLHDFQIQLKFPSLQELCTWIWAKIKAFSFFSYQNNSAKKLHISLQFGAVILKTTTLWYFFSVHRFR